MRTPPRAETVTISTLIYPFAFPYSKFTYQQVHDDFGGGKAIVAIAFRKDETDNAARVDPAFSFTCTLTLSNTPVRSYSAFIDFAKNHGKDKATVLNNVTVNFPSRPAVIKPPAPFLATIPLKSPFIFNGFAFGSLCWEMRIHTSPQSGKYVNDCENWSTSSTFSRFGIGGKSSGQTKNSELCYAFSRTSAQRPWSCSTTADTTQSQPPTGS